MTCTKACESENILSWWISLEQNHNLSVCISERSERPVCSFVIAPPGIVLSRCNDCVCVCVCVFVCVCVCVYVRERESVKTTEDLRW